MLRAAVGKDDGMADEIAVELVEGSGLYARTLKICTSATLAKTPEVVTGLMQLVSELQDAGNCVRYLQGAVLLRLREDERWRQSRPDTTFEEFVAEEIGLSARTARYLMDVYVKGTRLGLTAERITKIGWTKAREIVSVATPTTVSEWMEKAQTSTRVELRKDITIAKTKRADSRREIIPVEPRVAWTVQLTLEQREFVDSVVERVAAEDPSFVLGKGHALELVCAGFMAGRLPREKALQWHLAQIEHAYGVKLQIVSEEFPTCDGDARK